MSTPKGKIERLKALKNGRGIQHLLNEACKIWGNPLLIHDMEYKLVAYSDGAVIDDPIWAEFMLHGRLSNETLEFLNTEGFIDNVANCTHYDGVTYLVSNELNYNRIFGQLYNKKHMPIADLIAVECESPFDDDTPELMKTTCDILSKELSKSEHYQDYGQAYQEGIIKKLIEGSIEDKKLYAGHVANIDKGLKTNIFVAVADITQCDPEGTELVHFRDICKRTQPAWKYYIYSRYIVILMSSDDTKLNEKTELKKLAKLFERENIYAGISSGFENLFEMSAYYTEALQALSLGQKSNSTQQIFFAQ